MRKKELLTLSAIALFLGFAVSCTDNEDLDKTVVVDFEDVQLTDSIWNGSDLSGDAKEEESWGTPITNYYGSFNSGDLAFDNVYTEEWSSWKGFSCSAIVNTTTFGYLNQYAVITGSGADNSAQYAVAYGYEEAASFSLPAKKIKSVMVANSTWSYLYVKENFSAENYLKVTFTGYKEETAGNQVGYYLADYRDGKSFVNEAWTKVNLSTLGEVDQVRVEISSDDGQSPAFVCLDNIEFEK